MATVLALLAAGAAAGDYADHAGMNCYTGHGGVNIDSGSAARTLALADCEAWCDATAACTCVVQGAAGAAEASKCWRRSACTPAGCASDSKYSTFIKPPVPTPPTPPTPPPPTPPPPPPPGPPCADCPNILLMFTDDQDELLGGWEPMARTRAAVGAQGATASQWRIHTPICAPSRSEMLSGRYYHNIKSDYPTPGAVVSSGAVAHVDLGGKVFPYAFPIALRAQKGYATALFGKCMNGNCGKNQYAGDVNFHQLGAFDAWFEGTGYVDGTFYDNSAPGCDDWPASDAGCSTTVGPSTAGAGYLTSELGNRTIAWLRKHEREQARRARASVPRRPWFVFFAPHAPHGPATPAPWHKDACAGVASPRTPDFNFTGAHTTSCSVYPPGAAGFARDGPRQWWNGTDLPEITSCQPPIDAADAAAIDARARHRCQTLLSVDDSYAEILEAVEELGQLNNTYVLVTSDHGYNLGQHMIVDAKMMFFEHSLRIPMLFKGPGIARNSTFDFLGTQVDLAPTILGLAGIAAPPYMDGKDLVPLLVRADTAAAQREALPGSVRMHLSGAAGAPPPQRTASYHVYYNQGPWETGCGHEPPSNWCKPQRHPLDDWSNTWMGVHYRSPHDGAAYKYAAFDPYGKQSNFSQPYMHLLFNLTADPFELDNVYNATLASQPALVAELEAVLRQYSTCAGQSCAM